MYGHLHFVFCFVSVFGWRFLEFDIVYHQVEGVAGVKRGMLEGQPLAEGRSC